MSQKDTTSQKKATPGGSKRGNTKYRMQAIQQEQESGKVTGNMTSPFPPADLTGKTGDKLLGDPGQDSVRGLWKSKVLASYHGSTSQPPTHIEGTEQDYADAVHEAMISIIDRVFDIFQNSAYEFNKIAAGSELELNWVRPFLTKEGAPSWMGSNIEPVSVFTGRMSTRLWTLIMKGTVDMVQTYILPTSKLMTFNINSGTFKPYLQLEPYFENGALMWRLDSHRITPALLQPIARELFNGLIRFAKNECRDDEEFDLVNIGLVAPKPVEDPSVEIERQRYYQQAFLEDLKSHLDTRRDVKPTEPQSEKNGPPPSEFNQPLPEHIRRELEFLRGNQATNEQAPSAVPAPGFQSGNVNWKTINGEPAEKLDSNIARQLQRMAEDATGLTQAQAASQFAQPHGQPQPQRLSQSSPQVGQNYAPNANLQGQQQGGAPAPQRPAAPVQAQSIPAQVMRPPNSPAPTNEQVAQAMAAAQNAAQSPARPTQPINLPAALNLLIQSLDREMEVVAKAGADAFALRDLGRADAALKFSARLADYRQTSQELLEYYRRKR